MKYQPKAALVLIGHDENGKKTIASPDRGRTIRVDGPSFDWCWKEYLKRAEMLEVEKRTESNGHHIGESSAPE